MKSPRCKQTGFSLIEITIALGILAFAFTAMLGMLPVGLQTFSRSMDDTITTQIVQLELTAAQQTPFENLDQLAGDRYYTEEGAVGTDKDFVYQVLVEVPGPSAPDPSGTNIANLKTVKLLISKNRTVEAVLKSGSERELISRTFMISNVGL